MSTLSLDDYQDEAMIYRKSTATPIYALLGLSGEVGELHSHIAKAIRNQTEEDYEYIKKELGDILWFVAALAQDFDFSLEEVAITNLNKLAGRKARGTIGGSGDDR